MKEKENKRNNNAQQCKVNLFKSYNNISNKIIRSCIFLVKTYFQIAISIT